MVQGAIKLYWHPSKLSRFFAFGGQLVRLRRLLTSREFIAARLIKLDAGGRAAPVITGDNHYLIKSVADGDDPVVQQAALPLSNSLLCRARCADASFRIGIRLFFNLFAVGILCAGHGRGLCAFGLSWGFFGSVTLRLIFFFVHLQTPSRFSFARSRYRCFGLSCRRVS